ncbi:MAG: PEP-CTERM sorting domain-containing protein [Opitutae bacterium]|nr:PEP-CTERM sorting domain-containing protein [Opitutae bacterium]
MKRLCPALFIALACVAPAVRANNTSSFYYWTGLGTGWQGQLTPVSGDTTYLWFSQSVNQTVTLPGDFTVGGVFFNSNGDSFKFLPPATATSPVTLTLGYMSALDSADGRFEIASGINLGISSSGSSYWSVGSNTAVISGQIVGYGPNNTGDLFLVANNQNGGAFIFNGTAGNTYVGSTYLGDGSSAPTVAFWNSSPFGTGTVYVQNGTSLVAHNTLTVANNFVLNTNATSNNIALRSWDAPLTLSGTLTLANNVAIVAQTSPRAIVDPDSSGMLPLNGAGARHPIVVTGNVVEDALAGARSLTVGGNGILLLAPNTGLRNSYSGGTTVNGTLIFGNDDAIPTTGNLTVNSSGYVGTAVTTTGYVSSLLSVLSGNSGNTVLGALGIDTLPSASTTALLTDDLDLRAFTTNASTLRLGTATKATLASAMITPNGTHYRFGNGGGTLNLLTALTDTTLAGTAARAVQLDNGSNVPLKLFLQGANTYTGGTISSNGILVFDGAAALPNYSVALYNGGKLTTGGSATDLGGSYLGYTDAVAGLTPSAFLSYFDPGNTWGIVGFDTHGTNATVSVANVDLTGFTDGVFLGTATRATLTGAIKPTTVANTGNATAGFVRLTAANGGTLTVNAALLAANGVNSLELGSRSFRDGFSDGTIVIAPDASSAPSGNTYAGGTYVNGNGPLTLEVGGVNPLGPSTSTLTLMAGAGNVIGLQASTAGYTLANPIVFGATSNQAVSSNFPATLNLTGTNAFTLSGNLSGSGSITQFSTGTPPTVTLSGDNSNFTGQITLLDGTLNLASNHAAGGLTQDETTGTYSATGIELLGPNATVAFTGAATAPTLYGLKGDSGHLIVPDGTTLTFDMTAKENVGHDFGGTISAAGGAATNANLIVTSAYTANGKDDTEFLYLYGDNQLASTSTITVSGVGALAFGNDHAAGSATVVIDGAVSASGEPRGGLALNDGVVLTNPLTFNTGALAGVGTFAPTTLKQNNQTVTRLTLGANQAIFPGIPGDTELPGKLTLGTSVSPLNVAFANGGLYIWTLQDPLRSDGYSLLYINGSLDLSGLGAGGFVLELSTVDFYGNRGYAVLTDANTYVLPLVEATGGITLTQSLAATGALGQSVSGPQDITALFTFQTGDFQSGLVDPSSFHVLLDGNTLSLSFAAVPEPGTYALFALGLLALAFAAWRRRV